MDKLIPGKPARGTSKGRPIMVLLDLLGRRQALRILWELGSTAPLTFRELQARCDNISPTVLNNRIKELREAMIIERAPDSGYVLTELGLDLTKQLAPINAWSKKWAKRFPSA